jgi:hypothetical protein
VTNLYSAKAHVAEPYTKRSFSPTPLTQAERPSIHNGLTGGAAMALDEPLAKSAVSADAAPTNIRAKRSEKLGLMAKIGTRSSSTTASFSKRSMPWLEFESYPRPGVASEFVSWYPPVPMRLR